MTLHINEPFTGINNGLESNNGWFVDVECNIIVRPKRKPAIVPIADNRKKCFQIIYELSSFIVRRLKPSSATNVERSNYTIESVYDCEQSR